MEALPAEEAVAVNEPVDPEKGEPFVERDEVPDKTERTIVNSTRPDDQVYEDTDDDVDPADLYPMREVVWDVPWFSKPISFNPLVSFIGIGALWGLAIWCMVDPSGSLETLVEWRGTITLNFTWIFIGSKAVFFFYLMYVAFKFGHIKLGNKDEPPAFSAMVYFAMIFAAGVATGLFVFSVSEPLWHQSSHFYAQAGYRSQDEIDMFAINLTISNWSIMGWAPYLIVALSMALAGHRFHMPMTLRSCFFPILGDYTWGWIGDIVDGFAIVVTVAGVCTSLGLGAVQIVAAFQYLGWVNDDASQDQISKIQNGVVWAITVIATASVISGLHVGIKYLSLFAFSLGMLLLFLVFVMDDTKFLLNLQVQETGYFFQYSIFVLNFWTDAFGQLREGSGRATDGNAAAEWWMDTWMIFYQAWWVSWACFVGLFVARISRGRTVAQLILYSMVAPIAYCIMWFCIWGGTGLRQARQADELEVLGETYFGNSTYFQNANNPVCYDVPQSDVYDENGTLIFTNHLPGVTPVCQFDPANSNDAALNVLHSFSFPESFSGAGLGPTLSVIFIIALVIYFATSSDSGSLMVDHLASNGRLHHHWIQRLFWAITEGAVATALLTAGGSTSLQAVQAASIVCGLPFAFMLCYLIQSIYCFCKRATGSESNEFYEKPDQPEFSFPIFGGVFNSFEYIVSLGRVHPERVEKNMDRPHQFQTVEFVKGLFAPFYSLHQVLHAAYPRNCRSNSLVVFFYGLCFLSWIALFSSTASYPGLRGWAWASFFICGCILTGIRYGFRVRYNLRSNPLGDFLSSLFIWPQVLAQMRDYCVRAGLPSQGKEEA